MKIPTRAAPRATLTPSGPNALTDFSSELAAIRNPELQVFLNSLAQTAPASSSHGVNKGHPPKIHISPNKVKKPMLPTLATMATVAQQAGQQAGGRVSPTTPGPLTDTLHTPHPPANPPPATPGTLPPTQPHIQSLDSQVESWLETIIERAGHAVVVPKSLTAAHDTITEARELALCASVSQTPPLSLTHDPKATANSTTTTPLSLIHLDKTSLLTLGLPPPLISRIYRALYVYSIGFHDLIATLNATTSAIGIDAVVWQTFVHLIKEVNPEIYGLKMAEIGEAHKQHTDDLLEKQQKVVLDMDRRIKLQKSIVRDKDSALLEQARALQVEAAEYGAVQREMEELVESQKREILLLREEQTMANDKIDELEIMVEDQLDEIGDVKEDLRVERETVLRLTRATSDNASSFDTSSPTHSSKGGSFASTSYASNSGNDANRVRTSSRGSTTSAGPSATIAMSNVADRRRSSVMPQRKSLARASIRKSSSKRDSSTAGNRRASRSPRKSLGGREARESARESRMSSGSSILTQLHGSSNASPGGSVSSVNSNILRRLSSKLGGHTSADTPSPVPSPHGSGFQTMYPPLTREQTSPLNSPRVISDLAISVPPQRNRGVSFASEISAPSIASPERDRAVSWGEASIHDHVETSAQDISAPALQEETREEHIKHLKEETAHDSEYKAPDARHIFEAQEKLTSSLAASNEETAKLRIDNGELKEEITVLLAGVQELSKKNFDLEVLVEDQEKHEESLHDEIDELALQLAVMEASKNDVARQFNNQQSEITSLYGVVERDTEHRHELNAKIRQKDHEAHVHEKEAAKMKDKEVDLMRQVDVHKSNAHHVHDMLHETEKALKAKSKDHEMLESKFERETSSLQTNLIELNHYANAMENQLAATRMQADVLEAVSDKLQNEWDRSKATVAAQEATVADLSAKLSQTEVEFKREKKVHTEDLNLLEVEVVGHDESKRQIRELTESSAGLETDMKMLLSEVGSLKRKIELQRDTYNALAAEMATNEDVINEITSELEHSSYQRLSQVSEKDILIARHRKESQDLDEELASVKMASANNAIEAKSAFTKMHALAKELEKESKDKLQLMSALHKMVDVGHDGQAQLDAWMTTSSNAGLAYSKDVEKEQRQTENEARRGSIFERVDLGDSPPPLNLTLMSARLIADNDDFLEARALTQDAKAVDASPEVAEVLEASLVIHQMMRRFEVFKKTMKDLRTENRLQSTKLKMCKKEFLTAEEHWHTVNVNLSKAAREESAALKKDLTKKKTLLMAARKMSENMNVKIKGLQKDLKTMTKKYDKSQNVVCVAKEQSMMSEEDARGMSMRFTEVRRLQKVTSVAHKTMHNVFTSVWHNIGGIGEEEEEAGDQDQANNRKAKEKKKGMVHMRHHADMSSILSDVESLWLSPQQVHLEAVLNGVSRINEVWDDLTHTFNVRNSELRNVNKQHKILVEKHHHLEKWAEKETIRKAGMKEFGTQFNSYLREPREVGGMTEVSWLHRVPQMNDAASSTEGFQEKIMNAMDITWDEKVEQSLLKSKSMMEDVSRRETMNQKPNMNLMGGRGGGALLPKMREGERVEEEGEVMRGNEGGRPPPVDVAGGGGEGGKGTGRGEGGRGEDEGRGEGEGKGKGSPTLRGGVTSKSTRSASTRGGVIPKAPTGEKKFWGNARASVRVGRTKTRVMSPNGSPSPRASKSPSPSKRRMDGGEAEEGDAPAVPNIYRHSVVKREE